jgi:membrane-bound ClpP family serine protease
VLPIFIASPIAYFLIRAGRQHPGNVILMSAIGLQSILLSLVQKGASVPNAIAVFALIAAIGLGTLPRKYVRHVLITGLIFAIVRFSSTCSEVSTGRGFLKVAGYSHRAAGLTWYFPCKTAILAGYPHEDRDRHPGPVH